MRRRDDVSHTSIAVLVVIIAICCALQAKKAWGQQHEGHDWYSGLKSNQGYSCCNGTNDGREGDCRSGAVWRDMEGRVWARLNGATVPVPPGAVLPDRLNQKPLTGHICEKNGLWYCALVGGAGG